MKYHFILQNLTEFWAAGNSVWIRHCTSQGDNQLSIANLNPQGVTGAGLDGDIALFLLYRNRMDERSIKLHHKVFCNWYQITHDPINF